MEFEADVFVSDNPFLLLGDNLGAAAADIAVRPHLDWKLDHRTRLELAGEAAVRQYHRRYGNFFTGSADVQLNHRRNEYLTVGGRIVYDRGLVADPLSDSIDFAFDSSGIHESTEVRPAVTWTPDARTIINADVGWRKLRYPDSAVLQPTNAFDAGISASKRVSPVTSLGAQARFMTSRSSGDGDTSVRSFSLVATHRFSTNLHGEIQAGAEWTTLDNSLGRDNDVRVQFGGGFSLCHETPRTAACLTGAIRSEVSGFGGLQREKSLGSTLSHRISERGTISAQFDARQADLPEDTRPARILRASGGYEHRLDRNVFITSRATYMQREMAGRQVGAAVLMVGLSIRGAR